MWTIRITLLAILGAIVWLDSFLLRHRRKYAQVVESRAANIAIIAAHLVVTYAIVTLPPAPGWSARPDWLESEGVSAGFTAVGAALIFAGITLKLLAFGQRRAIGLQGAREGLITSHVYRHFRHPICTGVLWISLGLALLTKNPDGLLAFPFVFAAYLAQVHFEERDDLRVTFGEQYDAYRQTTGVFGPVRIWAAILVTVLLLVVLA